jgi:hypothetical protein
MTVLDEELDSIRAVGARGVREMVAHSPLEAERDELRVTARVNEDGERLMVLVEVWSGRRIYATGGFAMHADGSVHSPH